MTDGACRCCGLSKNHGVCDRCEEWAEDELRKLRPTTPPTSTYVRVSPEWVALQGAFVGDLARAKSARRTA